MLLEELVQHLGLLGMVELSGRHSWPDAVRRHQGLGLQEHIPLQAGKVGIVLWLEGVRGRWGWRRGTLEVRGGRRRRRRRRVLQAGRGSHVTHIFGSHGPEEVRIWKGRKSQSQECPDPTDPVILDSHAG